MNGQQLLLRLAGTRDYLQPALARVADIMLDDPRGAATCSIRELAERAATSEASVVRLAQELGFPGWRELRPELMAAAVLAPTPPLDGDLAPGDSLAAVIAKIAAADSAAVEETSRGLDVALVEEVVHALAAARRIVIHGMGASGLVASDLEQKLVRIGRVATSFRDVHMAWTSTVLLDERDVAVAISHSGSTTDTVEPMREARRRGATTVAITNVAGSPLAQTSDHVLLTAARETTFRSGATASRLAQLTVVDCVFVALAQLTYADSERALRETHDALAGKRPAIG